MASSQVEIVSSSPFGCVLRDHNRRDKCSRESNARASFQKNLKELVRDNLHPKISVGSASTDETENHVISNTTNTDQVRNLRCITNGKPSSSDSIESTSTNSSIRKSRNLERWAARQAQEMVSTMDKQSAEAELVAASTKTTTFTGENSQNSGNQEFQCGNSSEVQNLGASSLVQMWEARLNQSSGFSNNQNSVSVEDSANSSESGYIEIIPSPYEDPPSQSNNVDSAANDESYSEWDSNTQSVPSSVPSTSRNSDAGEGERVRIADIIRRLTSDGHYQDQANCNGDSPVRRHSFGSDQAEVREIPQLISLPRIRGRQALNDLLFLKEQERRKELHTLLDRKAVSRFKHRGRIQSMLRIRCLQRGLAIQDQQATRSTLCRTSLELIRPQQGSTIMHLRERFSPRIDQSTAMSSAAAQRDLLENVNGGVRTSNSSAHQNLNDENRHEASSSTKQQNNHRLTCMTEMESTTSRNSTLHINKTQEDVPEDTSVGSDVHCQLTISDTQEMPEATPSLNEWDENEIEEDDDDEETDDQMDFEETPYDWFTEIARPRSYWEDRRQAWYDEILGSGSGREDIRQLLERRTVSSFLSSDFRERMDQLIMSRVQRHGGEDEMDEDSQEGMDQIMLSFFQRHLEPESSDEEQQEVDEIVEDEEEQEREEEQQEVSHEDVQIRNSHEYLESTDYFDQSSPSVQSPSPLRSWSEGPHHEFVDDSEQISNENSPQVYNHDWQHSSTTQSSIEAQLIHDLRGHIEQLQSEMSELRKSMQSCIEMQVKLQYSIKQDGPSVQGDGTNSIDRTSQRRSCCICYEMPVDSFLYRCGHMCTCIKCAHELQWSSGKCPICRAPILDVVRAYMDS